MENHLPNPARQAVAEARREFSHIPASYEGRAHLAQSLDAIELVVEHVSALPTKLESLCARHAAIMAPPSR